MQQQNFFLRTGFNIHDRNHRTKYSSNPYAMNPPRQEGPAKRDVNEAKNVNKRLLKFNQEPPKMSKLQLKQRSSASYDAYVNRVKWIEKGKSASRDNLNKTVLSKPNQSPPTVVRVKAGNLPSTTKQDQSRSIVDYTRNNQTQFSIDKNHIKTKENG